MTVLPIMPKKYITDFEAICDKFIWNNKKPKIKLSTLQMLKIDGGAGLVDFRTKDLSLKASWVQILPKDEYLQAFAYRKLDIVLKDQIWKANITEKDVKLCFHESFWRDVLQAWSLYNFQEDVDNDRVNQQCSGTTVIFAVMVYLSCLKKLIRKDSCTYHN